MASSDLLSIYSSDTDVEELDAEHGLLSFEKHGHDRHISVFHTLSRKLLYLLTLGSSFRRAGPCFYPLRLRRRRSKFHILKDILFSGLFIAALFILVSILNGVLRPSYMNPPLHYANLDRRIAASEELGRGNPNGERIYIAANIINEDLITNSWSRNLLELIDILGHQNVFLSIYENDSGPGTSKALLDLREKLPCNSSIVTGDHVPLRDFPRVILPDGSKRTKRITYLAEIRNRLLLPLEDPSLTKQWAKRHSTFTHAVGPFDRILFLNDVFFTPTAAAQLLFSTNQNPITGRAEYTSACAIDFVGKAIFYDSFVVRDTEGYGIGFFFYPWFSIEGSSASRSDVLAQKDAVRVRSCWGGMAAFDASMFIPQSLQLPATHANNTITLPAIRFRSTSEPFWEAAECCLIFADLEVRNTILTTLEPSKPYALPANGHGVFINPYVRVAYDEATWSWLPTMQRYERTWQYLQYFLSMLGKNPIYNPRRTNVPGATVVDKVWAPPVVASNGTQSSGRFEMVTRTAEPGGWCGQRKLFVMKEDIVKANWKGKGKNWEQIKIPAGA